ncbi:TauD/TfdA dioxygenase family protein [Alteromonas lipolytica]|uniref:Taurine dioxygenase n=1 Tax=Alteromonas lipolytica TaxID=1856405 RepID=A0A1E8FK83_9ALTE|nr:TauD/TfdA family dioxygenase [Alteromonas lipolytica]OFI36347.1 taurine dioxygenase [Alteromonas lipolytica]GGF70619.1 taurine dioxygenase [Alteromonas lipolytica]
MNSHITVTPLTRRIGAEVSGVDLTQPLSEEDKQGLFDALMQHQVIFLRDQKISHEQHREIGSIFSDLIIHPGAKGIDGYEDIVAIHADKDSKYIAGDNWHSDLSCNEIPPMGSMLYLHTLPQTGGDTLWSSMYAVYEALSPGMQQYLSTLQAEHDANHVYHAIYGDYGTAYPCNVHPVVRTHPVTGRKAIFVNESYTTKILGVSKNESDGILQMLYNFTKDPNFQVRFNWQPHSIAIWDNRCTQHFAVWDYFPDIRSGFRVTMGGEKPE